MSLRFLLIFLTASPALVPIQSQFDVTKPCKIQTQSPGEHFTDRYENSEFVSGELIEPGTFVTLHCVDGFKLAGQGVTEAICLGNGEWVPKLDHCTFDDEAQSRSSWSSNSGDTGDSMQMEFFTAVIDGDLMKMEQIWNRHVSSVSSRFDVNWVDADILCTDDCYEDCIGNVTALQRLLACDNESSMVATARWLVQHGASLDVTLGFNQLKPIHLAVDFQKRSDTSRMLLEEGRKTKFDVANHVDRFGDSALMYAIKTGRPDLVGILLENGAKVSYRRPSDGLTPLMVAAEHNDDSLNGQAILHLLLEKGKPSLAEIDATKTSDPYKGCTAIAIAAKKTYRFKVEALLAYQRSLMDDDSKQPGVTRPIVTCGQLPVVANGFIETTGGSTMGSTRRVVCDVDFALIGRSIVSCQNDGTWTEPGRCETKACNKPPAVANGFVTDNNVLFCFPGFVLQGSNMIECRPDGGWIISGQCLISRTGCGNVPQLLNGYFSDGDSFPGSARQLICNENFEIDGPNEIICLANNTWTLPGHCYGHQCPPPSAVINGHFSGLEAGIQAGTSLNLNCDNGYAVRGPSFIVCRANGTWTLSGTCVASRCGQSIQIPNGHIECPEAEHSIGIVRKIFCDVGFAIRNGPSEITCFENGTWSASGTCEPIDCGEPPMPENGFVENGETTFGKMRHIFCDPGFWLEGLEITVCQANGSWSVAGSCISQATQCQSPPELQNALIVGDKDSSNFPVGAFFVVNCANGYELQGSGFIRCMSTGKWLWSGRCAVEACSKENLPSVANGYLAYGDPDVGTGVGFSLRIICFEGFQLSKKSPKILTCLPGARWIDLDMTSQCVSETENDDDNSLERTSIYAQLSAIVSSATNTLELEKLEKSQVVIDLNWVDDTVLDTDSGCFVPIKRFSVLHRALACRAASSETFHIVKWLVQHGASISRQQDYKGYRPIHLAVGSPQSRETVSFLIDQGKRKGIDLLYTPADSGELPIHTAILGGHFSMVELLVDHHKACIHSTIALPMEYAKRQRKLNGFTNLMLAAFSKSHNASKIVEFLIKRAVGKYGQTGLPLFIDEIMANDPTILDRNQTGWTALSWAAYAGQSNIFHILVQNGADTEKGCFPDGDMVGSVAEINLCSSVVDRRG